jgi:hypothetical protein
MDLGSMHDGLHSDHKMEFAITIYDEY